jgi:hypothetical protein
MDYVGPKTEKLKDVEELLSEDVVEAIRNALNERKQLAEQLTIVQRRCTELLMEKRRLEAELLEERLNRKGVPTH